MHMGYKTLPYQLCSQQYYSPSRMEHHPTSRAHGAECRAYTLLTALGAGIVTVGHRPSLRRYHTLSLDLTHCPATMGPLPEPPDPDPAQSEMGKDCGAASWAGRWEFASARHRCKCTHNLFFLDITVIAFFKISNKTFFSFFPDSAHSFFIRSQIPTDRAASSHTHHLIVLAAKPTLDSRPKLPSPDRFSRPFIPLFSFFLIVVARRPNVLSLAGKVFVARRPKLLYHRCASSVEIADYFPLLSLL